MSAASVVDLLVVLGTLTLSLLVVGVAVVLMHVARRIAERGWPTNHRTWE